MNELTKREQIAALALGSIVSMNVMRGFTNQDLFGKSADMALAAADALLVKTQSDTRPTEALPPNQPWTETDITIDALIDTVKLEAGKQDVVFSNSQIYSALGSLNVGDLTYVFRPDFVFPIGGGKRLRVCVGIIAKAVDILRELHSAETLVVRT